MTRSPTPQSLCTRPSLEFGPRAVSLRMSEFHRPKLEPGFNRRGIKARTPARRSSRGPTRRLRRTAVSELSTRALDRDGEVQASLVVAQLERRRPDAFAHSRRVAQLAVRVAQLARLPESEIRQVYWGGLVHDIGERDVPEPILTQPGPLATIERKAVDLHPAIGSRWLAGTPG